MSLVVQREQQFLSLIKTNSKCHKLEFLQLTEFRQPLQVQSHLEMPGILVQLGHIQRTKKLAPQIDLKRVTYMEPQTVLSYMSVKCTRRTLCMPNFTHATHAQPSLSNFPKWDSNFGELTHSRGMTDSDEIFQLPPKIKYQTHTLFDIHINSNNIFPTDKINVVLTLVGLPQRSQL